MTFGGLEYTADSRGELVLLGWAPGRIENSSGSTPESIFIVASPETPDVTTYAGALPISSPDIDPSPTSEVAPCLELNLA